MANPKKTEALLQSELKGIPLLRRGKVRDLYDLGEHLLLVATDRLSAFDVILPNGIPDKGKILTQLSVFWFRELNVPNHLVTADVREMPPLLKPFAGQLEGRSMLARKLEIMPVECVVRGYLAGSGWTEYSRSQSICGVALPPGLKQSERLPEPIFTPSTKAEAGHDLPMTFAEVEKAVGAGLAAALKKKSLATFKRAAEIALARGVLLCDTKFEWGVRPGTGKKPDAELFLADEVLTPDSSRFWMAANYQPGKSQEAFDKQFVRDYLNTLAWNKTPPGPVLPAEVVEGTRQRYVEIYERLTGKAWA